MTVLHAKHEPYWDSGHLGEVVAEMVIAGAPTIRAVQQGEGLYALEGSHRIAAAWHLGLIPKVILLEPDLDLPERVPEGLPAWEFPHLLALRERAFS